MTTTTRRVSQQHADIVLHLVADWMGQRGYAESYTCPQGRQLDQFWVKHLDDETPCDDAVASAAPTGSRAAYRGLGPELRMDWDWPSSGPTPAVILEGGPYDWAVVCCGWVQDRLDERGIPVFVEPYSGWALCLYPND